MAYDTKGSKVDGHSTEKKPEWSCTSCGKVFGKYKDLPEKSPQDEKDQRRECDSCGSNSFTNDPRAVPDRGIQYDGPSVEDL